MLSFTRRFNVHLLFSGGQRPTVPSPLHRRPESRVSQNSHACVVSTATIQPQSELLLKETPAHSLMGAPIYASLAMPLSWWIRWTSRRWLSLLLSKGALRPTTIPSRNGVFCRLHCRMALRTINHATFVLTWSRRSYPPLRFSPHRISCTTGLR
jgi:hypothetical protein